VNVLDVLRANPYVALRLADVRERSELNEREFDRQLFRLVGEGRAKRVFVYEDGRQEVLVLTLHGMLNREGIEVT
jgi:DNA-binding MarR family transcriptional regulator